MRAKIRFFATCLLVLLASLQATATLSQSSVFFVVGDTGDCDSDGTARVAAAIRAQPGAATATLIAVGDLAYPVATRARLLECHEPHWGAFGKRLAVPGNHDWADPGAAGFFSIFPQPVPRVAPLAGPWRLLMLDSNLRGDAWEAQLNWLDQLVARSGGECLIAAWHHPRWSSGRHGDNLFAQPLWARLQGVATLSLHGHDHHFEALPALDADGNPDPAGVTSFVVGNGGARLYSPGSTTHSLRTWFGEWGFLRLELEAQRYRWQAIGADGAIKDSDQGVCRPARAPAL